MIGAELLQLDEAARNPHEWRKYRTELRAQILEVLQAAAGSKSLATQEATILEARVAHDLLYVADRLRKNAVRRREPVPDQLLRKAEEVFGKSNLRSVQAGRRSAEEERYVIAARVNWHKLLKRMNYNSATLAGEGGGTRRIVLDALDKLLTVLKAKLEEGAEDEAALTDMAAHLTKCREACLRVPRK